MSPDIVKIIGYVILGISSVANVISGFISYMSCDSCKAKRELKIAKLMEKIKDMESKKDE